MTGGSMKCFRAVLVGTIVLGWASVALANSSSDPKIIVNDPECHKNCQNVGTSFSFNAPESGRGTDFFRNGSGVSWFSLKLTEQGVPADLISCSSNAFAHCNAGSASGITTILLSGVGGGFFGIPNGHNFSITFGCARGDCSAWPPNQAFQATANTPEPTTLALVLTGLGGIVIRRKGLHRA